MPKSSRHERQLPLQYKWTLVVNESGTAEMTSPLFKEAEFLFFKGGWMKWI